MPIPGQNKTSIEDSQIDVDLAFLRLNPAFQLEVERERIRCEADIRRCTRLGVDGIFSDDPAFARALIQSI